jgi:putative nucleotidyltransferase with HDIG domain
MQTVQVNPSNRSPLELSDSGISAHCRRVAALALELADRLRMPAREQDTLERAALLHHYPFELLEPETLNRLLGDLYDSRKYPALKNFPTSTVLSSEVRRVLVALRSGPKATSASKLAQIVQICDFLDEQIALGPYESKSARQILSELTWMANEGVFRNELAAALGSCLQVRTEDVAEIFYRLPVYSAVALKLLSLPLEKQAGYSEMERLVSSDQVLAGLLIKAANSAFYNPARTISTIRHAIAYIGLEATRHILMAAAIQPLFASSHLRDLWKHSLEAAEFAERLARLSGRLDPKEVLLAGLVHDIGRLALWKFRSQFTTAYSRLTERGCPPVLAEMLFCDFDHGETGATGLRLWAFPEHLVTAVQYHHQPERSDSEIASLLYLTEFWTASEEDIPSAARLQYALNKTAIRLDSLVGIETKNRPKLIQLLSSV